MQNEESSREHTWKSKYASPTVFPQLENSAVERDNVFGQTPQAAKTARGKKGATAAPKNGSNRCGHEEGGERGAGTWNWKREIAAHSQEEMKTSWKSILEAEEVVKICHRDLNLGSRRRTMMPL